MKDVNILTASNELASSLKPGDTGLELAEAVRGDPSMSEPLLPLTPVASIHCNKSSPP